MPNSSQQSVEASADPSQTTRPFVTIVIPAYNEEHYIVRCLSGIQNNDYPMDRLEVLLMDGASADRTRELAESVEWAFDFRIIDNPKRQRPSALNLGVKAAKHDIIMRIDARVRIPDNYISNCIDVLEESGAANVGGLTAPESETVRQWAFGTALTHKFGVGNAASRTGRNRKPGPVDSVYLGCFRKWVFDKVGPFDDTQPILSEDADMNFRINAAGEVVYFDPRIEAFYSPRRTFREQFSLFNRYGGARAAMIVKHGRATSVRQYVPIIAFVMGVLLLVASFITPIAAATLAALTGIYALAALT
ncbi:MAG: glycosyltransferase family 2 protein, partial [Candidatus Poribacteria bacterium]|nr:glycosyltransferase family 2 protein [Candidatus Poribacteria bacterium]